MSAPAAPPAEDVDLPDDRPDDLPDEPERPEPEPPTPTDRTAWLRGPWPGRVALALTWLVVAAGVGLRFRQWWFARSFWLDEVLLLRAMSEQHLGQVLSPLHYAQSAPPGWLFVEHLILDSAGGGERGARLLPFLFGCGAVALTALLAREVLGPVAALAATALVAFSTQLITYSAETKQYSADAFWLQLVLLLAVRLALGRGRPGRDRWVFGAVTAVAVWFSHATALAIGGVFLALGVQALVGRRWKDLLILVGLSVPFAAGLALEYVTLLSANAKNTVLQDFWVDTFPPDGPLTWSVGWDWFTARTRSVAQNPLYWHYGGPLATLLAVGLLVLVLRRGRAVPVLLLPVAVILAAGLAGSYPIANRLALWVIPLAALVVAAPLDLPLLAARLPRREVRWPAVVGVALVAAVAVAGQLVTLERRQVRDDAHYLARPRQQEETRTVLQRLADQRQPGDLVLVDWSGARWSAAYYAPRLGIGDYHLVRYNRPSSACYPTWLGERFRESRRYQRIWLVFSHTSSGMQKIYLRHLAQFGPVAERVDVTGAALVRFDRAVGTPAADPGPIRSCLTLENPATADYEA